MIKNADFGGLKHITINIAAGVLVNVGYRLDETGQILEKYRATSEPDFSVSIDDVEWKNVPQPELSWSSVELSAIGALIADKMTNYDRVALHGSAVAVDGDGYLFVAPSKIGKSTHAAWWRKLLGDHAVMINDDMPYLWLRNDTLYLCNNFDEGKHHLGCNACVPLKAVFRLVRGDKSALQKLTMVDAAQVLHESAYQAIVWATGFIKNSNYISIRKANLIFQAAQLVPFYRLTCCNSYTDAVEAFKVAPELFNKIGFLDIEPNLRLKNTGEPE